MLEFDHVDGPIHLFRQVLRRSSKKKAGTLRHRSQYDLLSYHHTVSQLVLGATSVSQLLDGVLST